MLGSKVGAGIQIKSLENVCPKSGEVSDLCFSIYHLPYFTSDLFQINRYVKGLQLNISKLHLAL